MSLWKDAVLVSAALSAVMVGVLADQSRSAQQENTSSKERRFLFTYAGTLKDLSPGKMASVWLPLAVSEIRKRKTTSPWERIAEDPLASA